MTCDVVGDTSDAVDDVSDVAADSSDAIGDASTIAVCVSSLRSFTVVKLYKKVSTL